MKKIPLLSILFIALFAFTSCSNDDDNSNGNDTGNTNDDNPVEVIPNQITYNGSEIEIVDGMVEYFGDWTGAGTFNFDVTLVNSQLTGPENGYLPEEPVFSAIYFEMFSENSADINPGTYDFAETAAAGTYAAAFVAVDLDINNPSEENVKQITGGTVTVIQNGDIYEFEFDGTTVEGLEVSMYFEGALQKVNFQNPDKMAKRKAPVKNFIASLKK